MAKVEKSSDRCIENCIEFLITDKTATCTFSTKAWISKVKKLAAKYPNKVKVVAENLDGSIVAHMPVSCISLKSPREKKDLSDAERKAIGERLHKSK